MTDTASQREIKAAFRRQAKRFHPDLNPGDINAERQFKAIAEAYEVLGNAARRADYDRWFRMQSDSPPPSTNTLNVEAEQFVATFREASSRVQSVFFDAILPRYLEKYDFGRGYQLVFHLTRDLDARTYMDIASGPKPSFSTTQRMHQLMQSCPIHIDGGANGRPKGTRPWSTHLLTMRRLSLSVVTLYAGSFFAKGFARLIPSVALMETIVKEYIRHLQQLPPHQRPMLLRETQPEHPIPFTEKEARMLDYKHVVYRSIRYGVIGTGSLVLAQWLWATFVQ